MLRDEIKNLMNQILLRQGKPALNREDALLRDLGFRSLDFSELALRIEQKAGRELNFDAASLRRIVTAGDVLDFMKRALGDA